MARRKERLIRGRGGASRDICFAESSQDSVRSAIVPPRSIEPSIRRAPSLQTRIIFLLKVWYLTLAVTVVEPGQ